MKKRETDSLKSDLKNQLENTKDPSEINKLKNLLRDIADKELGSLAVRARVDKVLYDEKCTSFFFNKIRRRNSKNFIHKILDEDNTLKTDIQDILLIFSFPQVSWKSIF